MSTMTVGSLRERKRIATWDALHEAAAVLAEQHDAIQAVTVEGIADLANVSQRTFFNYFATKEDAVLGNREPVVSEEALEAFRESKAPLVSRTADFYFDVMASSRTFGAGVERRLALVDRHPELRIRQVAHFTRAEQMVREAALENLTGWVLPDSVPTFEVLVDLLVATSSAALRIAIRLPLTGTSAMDADRRAAMHGVLLQLREVSLHNS